MLEKMVERFLEYVKIDTQSDRDSKTSPSTKKQFDLANILAEQLKAIGLSKVSVSKHCYVMGTLEGNLDKKSKVPPIGFIAHMDTSPSVSGADVKPIVHKKYQGGDIELKGITIKADENPELSKYINCDIITSDGTTLLGADDKAGIAEIVSALEFLQTNSEKLQYGTVKVAFTPDEEVGRSTEHFDVKKFGAKYAYTVDGGESGEIESENFNAAKAVWTIIGKNVHPGYAGGKLVNAQKIAAKLIGMFPHEESPEMIDEKTEEDKGYYHIYKTNGDVEQTTLESIIRDFHSGNFEQRKQRMWNWHNELRRLYPKAKIELVIEDEYKNMKEVLDKHPEVVEVAVEAIESLGIRPLRKRIRGGTDGARLSFMGLPTPNLFAGGVNFHSRTEYVPIKNMSDAMHTVVKIPEIFAKRYQ
jgi:tripeptide aminopeptidase